VGHVATLNEALHEDPKNQPQILEAEVNQNIMELYSLGPGAFANSTAMFKHLLVELLQLPQAYKSHWVEMAKIAKAKTERKQAHINKNADLCRFG